MKDEDATLIRKHLTEKEVYDIFKNIFHNEEDARAATIQLFRVAAGLVKIYDYHSFDEYVSDTVKRDIDMMLDGAAPLDDQIHYKLTGKDSPYMQDVKKRFGPINKRLKQEITQ